MKIVIFVLPIALLVAYSQIIVKWRTLGSDGADMQNLHLFARMLKYLSDPILLSGYVAALLASFVWLYVIEKLSLVVAFPVYIGVTFVLVIIGGWIFLAETINAMRLVSLLLILIGIIIGVKN
jgi:multidrug transporter EmrE-like cation transporter